MQIEFFIKIELENKLINHYIETKKNRFKTKYCDLMVNESIEIKSGLNTSVRWLL